MNKAIHILLMLAIVTAGTGMRLVAPASADRYASETGVSQQLKEQAVARYQELASTHVKRNPFLKPIYYSSMIAWILIEALAGICFFLAYRYLMKLKRQGAL